MFYSNIISVLIMIIPALMFWVTPNFDQLILIFIMAICASIAHNFFIRAYAVGEASVIAPIDYIRLLFSAAVDFLIWFKYSNRFCNYYFNITVHIKKRS